MKKIISLCLTAMLLLSMLLRAAPFSVTAGELLMQWDMESNNLSDLGTPNGADGDGYYADGNVSIVPGGANGSSYALKISGANSGNGQTVTGLKPATEYELKFYARIGNWGGASFPNFGVNAYDGAAYVAQAEFTETWQEYTLVFTTGTVSEQATVYSWIFGNGAVDFYIDDVTLTEKTETPPEEPTEPEKPVELLGKWDFEHNDPESLFANEGYYADGNVSIVPGGANGSSYALKISGANSGNGQTVTGLKPATEYELKFYAKIGNWGGASFPNFGVNAYDGAAYVAHAEFTETWQEYTLVFTTGAASEQATVYSWIFGNGAVDFYIDDVSLTEIIETPPEEPTVPEEPSQPADPLKNWSFEHNDLNRLGTAVGSDEDGYYAEGNVSIVPGGANGSSYALKISVANSGNGQWLKDLAPNTQYTLLFMAKVENWGGEAFPNFGVNSYDGDAYSVKDSFTDKWAAYAIVFKTGDSTQACVYSWIFGSGNVDFYIDNVSLIPGAYSIGQGLPNTSSGTTESAAAAGVKFNGEFVWDFEKGRLSSVGTANGADGDGYYAEKNVSIAAEGANGSSYSLKISGANSGNGQFITGLQPNTEYIVTFDAKIANWGGEAYPNFGVNNYDGDKFVAADRFTEEWSNYSVSFRTGTSSTTVQLYTWIFGSGEVDFYLDNVVLKTKPVQSGDLQNAVLTWNLEDGNISTLGTPSGDDGDSYYAIGNVAVSEGGANNTGYALKISGGDSGNGKTIEGLKPDTEYVVTFYAKIANWGGTSFPNFGVNQFDGDKFVAQDTFTEQWKFYTLNFRTGADSTTARIYTWIFEAGEVDFFVDEVSVMEKALYQPETVLPGGTQDKAYTGTGETVLFAGYTVNPKVKWFIPIAIAAGVELAAIAVLAVLIVKKSRKKNMTQ